MKLKVDIKNDVIYLKLDESRIVESEEVEKGIILDYDENNKVVGIEILGIKNRVALEMLKKLDFETV